MSRRTNLNTRKLIQATEVWNPQEDKKEQRRERDDAIALLTAPNRKKPFRVKKGY